MDKNIKKFDKFVFEEKEWGSSLGSDLDPYGEENDDEQPISEYEVDDITVGNVYTETVYHIYLNLRNHQIKYDLTYDDEGFSWVELKNANELPKGLVEFCEENEEEIKDILFDAR